jgi:hypothetical protein
MPTIDALATVSDIRTAVAAAPSLTAATRAIEPMLAALAAKLKAPRIEGEATPMIRAWSPGGPRPGETATETAARLAFRLDEIALAKRWSDAADVQRVVDTCVRELRAAAIGSFQGSRSTIETSDG